jgi:hypothetical protein
MLMLIVTASIAGILCGFVRLRIWALLPIIVILPLIAVMARSSIHLSFGGAVFASIAAIVMLQLSYVVSTVRFPVRTRRRVTIHLPSRRQTLRSIQKAIADELDDYFELPNELPEQLRAKLAVLESVAN